MGSIFSVFHVYRRGYAIFAFSTSVAFVTFDALVTFITFDAIFNGRSVITIFIRYRDCMGSIFSVFHVYRRGYTIFTFSTSVAFVAFVAFVTFDALVTFITFDTIFNDRSVITVFILYRDCMGSIFSVFHVYRRGYTVFAGSAGIALWPF